MVYGVKGSGKSYTMVGRPDTPGLMPQTVINLFEEIEKLHKAQGCGFIIVMSYFEVDQEQIRDLLITSSDKQMEVHECPVRGIIISNLTYVGINTADEFIQLVNLGQKNKKSITSNVIMQLSVTKQISGFVLENSFAKLTMVELAAP